jgi:hypothetical protein
MMDGATMTRHSRRAVLALTLLFTSTLSFAQTRAAAAKPEPDYSAWTTLLQRYYDPAVGMNYAALKARDLPALQNLRNTLAKVDVKALSRDQQLAYWINLYNINSTAIVAEKYPIKSIRDLSTDPIIRLNVFDKRVVPFGNGKISLNDIENTHIREGFRDPRIHFAINCAAKSCPPIRREAFVGVRVQAQLDDQARTFLNGPKGMRISGDTVHVTKIMDWFEKDFQNWGGGVASFLRKYASPENRKKLDAAGNDLDIDYDDYDWSVNSR